MNEMIERVGSAVIDELGTRKGFRHLLDVIDTLTLQEEIRHAVARAAIHAMLKPTEAMLAAAVEEIDPGWIEYKSGEECWRAMIEEALK